jgi:bifunctional oligoribonuclease and PAP phosphatase NrnA
VIPFFRSFFSGSAFQLKAKSILALKTALSRKKNIAIVTHWSPDGDAMGSSLGLAQFLKKKGHTVSVVVPNEYPAFLYWMKGHKQVIDAQKNGKKAKNILQKVDFIFCLDFNDLKRITVLGEIIAALPVPKVMIDHHPEPADFAAYALHKTQASSTAELIYEFITTMGGLKLIDKDIANCLYTGIMTDTGSFRFPATTETTHKIIGSLIKAGADNSLNHNRVYDDNSESRLRLLGYALSQKMVVIPEFHTAFFTLNTEEHDRFNFEKGDTEGLVNYGLSMRGIVFSAFFSERDGKVKCSFRSKGNFDVNAFARAHFNGGGHKNAAGGQSDDSLDVLVMKFKALLPDYEAKLKKS